MKPPKKKNKLWRLADTCLLSATLFLVAGLPAQRAQAQTYQVIYNFTGGADGGVPVNGVVQDSSGNLYGTTVFGGMNNNGVIFKIDPRGVETVLHTFTGSGGSRPSGVRLASDALYGTTEYGGVQNSGVVFLQRISPPTYRRVYDFGVADGAHPVADLYLVGAEIYGSTENGGAYGYGEVFRIDGPGNLVVLYSFTNGTDGGYPNSGVLRDVDGNLYGTTLHGGTLGHGLGYGVVYKIDPLGNETVLYSFDSTNGSYPVSDLVADSGNFYGTTSEGGVKGKGVVFKLNIASGRYTVIHNFTSWPDGTNPVGNLVRDSNGDLYGITEFGSDMSCDCGMVYRIDPYGHETVIHTFDGTDGYVGGGLFLSSGGVLFGTTQNGGTYNNGVVFRITP